MPAPPGPVLPPGRVLPANHRFRSYYGKGGLPSRPHTREPGPEQAVSGLEPWPSLLAGEDGELLAEGEVLKQKVVPRPHSVTQDRTEEEKEGGQGWTSVRI